MMNKNILKFSVAVVVALSCLTASAQKVKQTEKEKKEVAANRKDSVHDILKFKKEVSLRIAENKEKIEKLKTASIKESADDKAKYDRKILSLEERNNELKKRINEYNDTDKAKWQSFEKEFMHDLKELGHALKDIGVRNTK